MDTNYKFSSLSTTPRSSIPGITLGKRDPVAEAMRRLEVRISAIEAVLLQLGHAQLLRVAQDEAKAGFLRPVVPPVESLLANIPSPAEEAQNRQMAHAIREKESIDDILNEVLKGDTSTKASAAEDSDPADAATDDALLEGALTSGIFGTATGAGFSPTEEVAAIDEREELGRAPGFDMTTRSTGDVLAENYF